MTEEFWTLLGLPDHWKFFQGHFVFHRDTMGYFRERLQGGRNGHLPPGIGTKNQKVLENLKSAFWFRLIDLILAITLYLPEWHSYCIRASFTILVWFSDELLTPTPLSYGRNVFFLMWLLTSDIYGRWCSETVTADNGKAHCFILCENKQEWICSSASASTGLKSITMRDCECDQCAWENSLIKLRSCSLLFTQYKPTWLVRNTSMKGLWEYVLIVKA